MPEPDRSYQISQIQNLSRSRLQHYWQNALSVREKIRSIQLEFIQNRINIFNARLVKIENKSTRSRLTGLKDLSPNDHADQKGHYDTIISWALKKRVIKNIALSGPYGSGKSSILKTFQKKHKHLRYLNISLAAFKTEVNKKDEIQVELILASILQQIFYYVKAKNTSQSWRFR